MYHLMTPLLLFRMPRAWLLLLLLLAQRPAHTQDNSEYYETFTDYLTTRVYLSKKYTSVGIEGPEGTQTLRYRPNSLTTMGINASYRALSLTLGSGFGFLNPGKEEKGKTKSFDFQTHLYTRDWVTDIYGQFYRGYYLRSAGAGGNNDRLYYLRPDLRANLVGASVYRLFNGKEFSYRAAYLQNEWQKQSAGSFLAGAEIYLGRVKGDSALVPSAVSSFYPQAEVKRMRFLEFGPGLGYAYTYVWQSHFFVTGSATINGDISFVREETEAETFDKISFSPNATLRAVAGYNSEWWALTISWLHHTANSRGEISDYDYRIKTGDFKITLAKRFRPGKKLKEDLDSIIDLLP
jgi:hypothetical protein